MKFLDNSTKHIEPMIEKLVFEKIGKKVKRVKFIGGGSYGRIYKTELSDGEIIAVKAYKLQGMQHNEAEQLRKLADNTKVEMPEVIFTYEDDRTALLAMSFIKGQNVLNPIFLLKSRKQKQCFAEEVISGMLEWHSVTGKNSVHCLPPPMTVGMIIINKNFNYLGLKHLPSFLTKANSVEKNWCCSTMPQKYSTPSLKKQVLRC